MLAQQLLNGLAQGSMYALIAVGFALIIGTLKLVTFAHGEVFMIGAFVAYTVVDLVGGNLLLAFALAILVAGALGVVIEFHAGVILTFLSFQTSWS